MEERLSVNETNFLDTLRGRYAGASPRARRAIAPLLALVPAGVRWGATYRQYRADIARSEADGEFVAFYQAQKFRALIRLCSRNPYYRSVFDRALGRYWESKSFELDDIRQIPVLAKSALYDEPERLLVKPLSKVDAVSTSGTSGRPFKFFLDRDRGAKEWAFHHHVWARIGYRLGHKRAVLRGTSIPNVDAKPWLYDAALRELSLSPFHLTADVMDRYLDQICSRGIHFLHGYPSAISIFANHVLREGRRLPIAIQGIIAISESLFDHQREVILRAFPGARILCQYGQSEKVAYAAEVPGIPDLYEFEPLYGYVELVDEKGESVREAGRVARLVATGFISNGMPLLRYDTGDLAELVRLPSRENAFRLQVRSIRSRWNQEFLVGRGKSLVSIAAINIHSPIYSRIREFQFFQDRPGLAQVRVVPVDGYGVDDVRPFVEEIQEKVGSVIRFELVVRRSIGSNMRGKRPLVDQKLDISSLCC